jgi:hypothetical protein
VAGNPRDVDATGDVAGDRPTEIRIGDSLLMITPVGEREPFPAFSTSTSAMPTTVTVGPSRLAQQASRSRGTPRTATGEPMVRDPFGNVYQIAHRRPTARS